MKYHINTGGACEQIDADQVLPVRNVLYYRHRLTCGVCGMMIFPILDDISSGAKAISKGHYKVHIIVKVPEL